MIAVVDYRAGNLASVSNALEFLGHEHVITQDAATIEAAERVIFPGVGAAGEAMQNLRELELVDVLRRTVDKSTPFLGICLGYQILFEYSEEDDTECLGLLRGHVIAFDPGLADDASGRPLKIPEMGWNHAAFLGTHAVWNGLPEGSEFYFVHSYYPVPEPQTVAALTCYGLEYASGVVRRNLAAFQFHPEKSGRPGLRLLDNFCRWQPAPSA